MSVRRLPEPAPIEAPSVVPVTIVTAPNAVEGFHRCQYVIASVLALVLSVLYVYAPDSKSEVLSGGIILLLGFVVGKFSNGYHVGKAE